MPTLLLAADHPLFRAARRGAVARVLPACACAPLAGAVVPPPAEAD